MTGQQITVYNETVVAVEESECFDPELLEVAAWVEVLYQRCILRTSMKFNNKRLNNNVFIERKVGQFVCNCYSYQKVNLFICSVLN